MIAIVSLVQEEVMPHEQAAQPAYEVFQIVRLE